MHIWGLPAGARLTVLCVCVFQANFTSASELPFEVQGRVAFLIQKPPLFL